MLLIWNDCISLFMFKLFLALPFGGNRSLGGLVAVVLGLVDHFEVFHLVLLVQQQLIVGRQLRHGRGHTFMEK